ncbi:tetratricopeptide repeat protein [Sphingosinicella rhizophila]|uniref:Tetratricopeptide repeat protein n=1 Tax=Sphingosinicella rhizophila TaxID=3050082 RepID=A0ABU3Q2K9_9SPHN|nr:tetratricopeptide repeat protein [Sphingosinicella sp. GR2756]MDT9597637.1 tetratricopeptide repeat protein [Sphingosinicella sp. GR2756]
MRSVSSLALGVALVLGASLATTQPAAAAKKDEQQPQMQFSKEERNALAPLQAAVNAKDWAAFTAALPAAQSATTSANAKFAIARWQLDMGIATNNVQVQSQAIDGLIASGAVQATGLPALYQNQGALAVQAGNNQKAEAAYAKLIELQPTNTDGMIELAKVKTNLKKPQEAIALIDRAIEAQRGAGQTVPESWYKYALKQAFDNKLAPQSLKLSRDLVAAYPSTENWRDSLLIYREVSSLDKDTNLDLLRLMRASKALSGERDWFSLAETLQMGGLPGEAKAVLDEGAALKMIDLNKSVFKDLHAKATRGIAEDRPTLAGLKTKAMAAPTGALALSTANAYFAYGDYAEAVALYKAAIGKGSIDTNLANSRLGMALALAGNKAEAETAFKAVTGPRATLASYWMAWLARS